ncbi:DUF6443 domain-containing protein [Hymenobacter canadensis]|uniref:DUF6443 domain-containing protein n=1 Tax=Hymenobacter canadensis TaxID=2999067 RepID=A0ABY7LVI1_9BACT|nr:DUF6443 domain-containing protein [Hymenobacter canadensis]WBA44390.1 DUF6443 domain-containing protein [Hymenobacter canadensis]
MAFQQPIQQIFLYIQPLLLAVCLCVPAPVVAQRAAYNYVRTETMLNPGVQGDRGDMSTTNKRVVYEYVDGIGRPLQTVAVQASPSGKDAVQPRTFDAQGRETFHYLPYTIDSDGRMRSDWRQEQPTFYDIAPKVSRDIRLYSESVFESSPLSQLKEQAAPGWSWQPSSGATVKYNTRLNKAVEVRECTYSPISNIITSAGPYAIGALTAQETTDEQGLKSINFYDSRGLLMCNNQVSTSGSTLSTCYLYSDGGKLLFVLPPECMRRWAQASFGTLSSTLLEDYAFQYKYDERGRLIEKKIPGAGWQYLIYDQWDRLVLKQDGNMRRANAAQWHFVKYDASNRSIITGIYNSAITNRDQLRADVAASNVRCEVRNTQAEGYTLDRSYPTGITLTQVLTLSFFDDYAYSSITSPYGFVPELGHIAENRDVHGMATATRVRGLGDQSWYNSVMYYDSKHRIIQVVTDNTFSTNLPGRLTKTYDFIGQEAGAKETITINGATRTIEQTNELDSQGRVIGVVCSIDGERAVNIAVNEYNELGQQVDKKLHESPGRTYLQSLDYRYNIRGWLTHLNNRDLSETSPWMSTEDPNEDNDAYQDLFGLELNYNGIDSRGTMLMGETAPLFNGSIAEQVWRSASDNQLRGYAYLYDGFNRITDGRYREWNQAQSWNTDARDNYTTSGITYDDNGNIATMLRNGLAYPKFLGYGAIDELNYTYSGNQVTRVQEALPTTDFRRKTDIKSSTDFQYDPNGNVERDSGKGSTIVYNYLNLPQSVQFNNGSRIDFQYSATGQRFGKKVYNAQGLLLSSVTSNGSFTFQTGPDRLFVATPEGRALYEPNRTSEPEKWVYEYHIKDHLGNLRMVFRDKGTDTYRASFEEENTEQESRHFDKLASIRQLDPMHAQAGQYAARLNAGQANRLEGAIASIPVHAGDSIHLEVYGLYEIIKQPKGVSWIVAAIPIGNTNTTQDGKTNRKVKPVLGAGLAMIPGLMKRHHAKRPEAAMHYEFYSRDSVLLNSKDIPLTSRAATGWEKLYDDFKADSTGYIRVSLINESVTDAWFDNATIGVKPSMIVQENHYDPWGLNLVGIERNGYPDDYKLQYNGKEMIENLDWIDYGLRYYSAQIGRWSGVDPLAEKAMRYSTYTYGFNNPTVMFDPDGAYPWSVHIRSFITTSTVGGGNFRGDGRQATVSTSREVTSRVRTHFVVDPSKGTLSNLSSISDPTVFYGGHFNNIVIPPMVKAAVPTSSLNIKGLGYGTTSFSFSHSAKDPITPQWSTPALDLHANLTFKEDLAKGILSITGSFNGDEFPSSEAFIMDQSGKSKVFLGAKMENGGLPDLFGDNKIPLFNVNMLIKIDDKGNFTGVRNEGTDYTVEQWNTMVQKNFGR